MKKDHTTAISISFIAICFLIVAFGIAVEILKFAALVKWVFA